MKWVRHTPQLPARPHDAHKGSCGHVLVLGGSFRYSGAPVLVGRAALRAGAGLSTIGCPDLIGAAVSAKVLCETTLPLLSVPPGVFAESAAETALGLMEGFSVVALGPGLTRHHEARAFARAVALRCPLPLVLDADGLNAFEDDLDALGACPGPRVLTPHPGEAARLLGITVPELLEDRMEAVLSLARRTGGVAVLKGPSTLVSDGESVYRNRFGNAGLATGGTGDVLTGVIAGLIAQGMTPFDAAALGTNLHGMAADIVAEEIGLHALMASDLLDFMGKAFLRRAKINAKTKRG